MIVCLLIGIPLLITYVIMRSEREDGMSVRAFEASVLMNLFYKSKRIDSYDMEFSKTKVAEAINDVEAHITELKESVPENLWHKIVWVVDYCTTQAIQRYMTKYAYIMDNWKQKSFEM